MRSWALTIDTIGIEGSAEGGLEIAFEVLRTLKGEPNTASVRIWNLSKAHRQQLEALSVKGKRPGRIRTELRAGEVGHEFLLFKGDLRYANSERDGADWVTLVEGDDGGRAHLDARVQRAFPPGTLITQAIFACTDALGLGLGNLPNALAGNLRTLDQGTVLSGQASTELRGLLRGLGFAYSVQHGVLQVLPLNGALSLPIVKLAPGRGLVASPTRTPEGFVQAVALLRPGLDPGCRVQIDSERTQDVFTVRSVKYEGDASAVPWYANLELKE